MGAVWRSTAWAACAAAALLAMGCGAAVESGSLEGEAFPAERDEVGEPADGAGGATQGQRGADVGEPGAAADGQSIAPPIKCGGHFPLCPPNMECSPIRKVEGEIAFGYCK
jgi:hypothetical protein